MIFTIRNYARKNATVFRVFWVVSGLSWGPHGLKMCDLRSLGMGEINQCRGMGIGMILGSHNMIFTILNNAWENAVKFGYFGLFLDSDGGPRSPRCAIKAPLGYVR